MGSRCRRLSAAAVLTVTAVVGLVGCSVSGAEDDVGVKNQAVWKMPLDDFFVYPVELDNYAEQLLIAECVGAQDFQWPVPWQNVEFPPAEDANQMARHLFNLELAKKWGYHFAPPADMESAELWSEFTDTADSYFPNQELDEALAACSDKIRATDENHAANFDGQNYLAELAFQAESVVAQEPAVMEAVVAWRECLAPQVDYEVPEEPTSGPPLSVRQKWGAVTGGTPMPSAEELAAAIADAECQESSGWSSLWYERNWEEQEKLVAENRDKLDRIRAEAVDRKEKLLTIVAENAPAAP